MDTSARTDRAPSRRGFRPPDPHALIRKATSGGLQGDGDRFVGELLGLLHSSDPSVRSSAATALGIIGDERVIPSLRSAADDPDATVAAAAAIARARLGDVSAPKEACERLSDLLRGGDAEQRAMAARALGALGLHDAYCPLVDALGDEVADVRRDAADALGRLGDARATEALATMGFSDPVDGVRSVALGALARLAATVH